VRDNFLFLPFVFEWKAGWGILGDIPSEIHLLKKVNN
jgi:hypothetical protein